MKINEHQVKVSGSASIDRRLELGKEYNISATGAITNIDHSNNEDGSYDQIHKLKIIYLTIESDGELIPAKDKQKQSLKLRRSIYSLKPDSYDEEAWYNYVLGGIRHHLEEIIELIKKQDL